MIKRIKQWLNYKNKCLHLTSRNELLEEHINKLQSKKSTAREVISQILDREIDWHNWEDIRDRDDRAEYVNEAKRIVDSKAFENECNAIISDIIQHIAKSSKDHRETENLRMTINGIELLRERLESVHHKQNTETREDLHSNI